MSFAIQIINTSFNSSTLNPYVNLAKQQHRQRKLNIEIPTNVLILKSYSIATYLTVGFLVKFSFESFALYKRLNTTQL